MPSKPEELRVRTKAFAIRIVRLVRALPNSPEGWVIGKQVLRSGTAVAANYRATCRARTKPEFIAKIGVVVEEADETVFWLELLTESGVVPAAKMEPLLRESRELTAMFTAAQRTSRASQ